jgi:hypothetical protein
MVIFAIAACGGRQLEVQSIPKSEHPQELVNKLDSEVALARNEKINVLTRLNLRSMRPKDFWMKGLSFQKFLKTSPLDMPSSTAPKK